MTTEALKELLAKVEGAKGPDRQLDAKICQGLDIAPWVGWCRTQQTAFAQGSSLDRETPKLTGSIDAALTLVERVLPGHKAGFRPCMGNRARGHILSITPTKTCLVMEAVAPTAALAIIAGLLEVLVLFPERALLAQGGDHA